MICPNCGKEMGTALVCPACGTRINNPDKGSNSPQIEKLIEVTSNFSKKPTCSESEFKKLVLAAMVECSAVEKSQYEQRIKAYTLNFLKGGNGIVQEAPVAGGYLNAEPGSASAPAPMAPTSSPNPKKPINKKAIIIAACIVGGLALIGGTVGIIVGVTNSRNKNSGYSYDDKTYVTFEKEGGYGGTSSIYISYGYYPSSIDVPYKDGYKFGGYYTNSDGFGTQYFDENGVATRTWYISSSYYTLYAYWQNGSSNTYITFDKYGGSGGTNATNLDYGQDSDSITKPTRSGYVFQGYYTSSYGGGTQYYDAGGHLIRPWDYTSFNMTLYAYWLDSSDTKTYVTFSKQNGTGGHTNTYLFYGIYPESIVIPTRSGWSFRGYYTDTNGYGTQYFDQYGEPTTYWDKTVSSITLYAYWW